MTTYISDNHDARYLSLNRPSALFTIWIAFKDCNQCSSETVLLWLCTRSFQITAQRRQYITSPM